MYLVLFQTQLKHIQAAKRVLTDGSLNPGLLWGYVDSYWAGCLVTRKSTTGLVLMLNGEAMAWKSKLQSVGAV